MSPTRNSWQNRQTGFSFFLSPPSGPKTAIEKIPLDTQLTSTGINQPDYKHNKHGIIIIIIHNCTEFFQSTTSTVCSAVPCHPVTACDTSLSESRVASP
ncbi:hypothetical protein RRG08_040896 [Elysia crispata]|uniref:Uncharacterized protein n=1 Tax=Elysia crispata TaxID=231223 RepID=A0AAE0YAU5_9GAST|nr:hypothetical protein RRG08_040896 [Elysia crispata]